MMKQIAVQDLMLDQDNPRFPPTATQRDAVRALLADDPPKLLNLIEDITTTGGLNPLDNVCVVMDGKDPVVVEGNRRVASLKLLRNPALADEPTDVSRIQKLRKAGKGPDTVECFVAGSRDEARHWIELRHTGENNGVGTKPWNAEQANRYRRRANTQADKAMRFCEAVVQEFPNDDELIDNVNKAKKERLTTIGRLVADPAVAQAFGFQITADDVLFDFESDEMLEGVRYIFRGMSGNAPAGESSVSKIKNKSDRTDYIIKAGAVLPSPDGRLPNPRLPGGSPDSSKPDPGATKGPAGGLRPPKIEAHIFDGLKLPSFSERVRHVLRASQKLRIDDATPVCAVMLRVVLEMAVTEVGAGASWFKESQTFAEKLKQALLHLDPECDKPRKRNKKYEAAWTTSQSSAGGGIAVEQMNSYVHNFMSHPLPSELRTLSLNFRPLLEDLEAYLTAV